MSFFSRRFLMTATLNGEKKAAQASCKTCITLGEGSSGPKAIKCITRRVSLGPMKSRCSSQALRKASKLCINSRCLPSQSSNRGSAMGSNHASENLSTLCSMKGAPLEPPSALFLSSGPGTSKPLGSCGARGAQPKGCGTGATILLTGVGLVKRRCLGDLGRLLSGFRGFLETTKARPLLRDLVSVCTDLWVAFKSLSAQRGNGGVEGAL